MNATKYYVSTCRLVIQANPENVSSWQDIYRVLYMLRNSLSCTVCDKLLTEPYTPEETTCEHHVCKGCRGGAKTLRPSCSWCKDYSKYCENVQLRLLIQSYRKLCALIKVTPMYKLMLLHKDHGSQIQDIIRESEDTNKRGFPDYEFKDLIKQEAESEQEEEEGEIINQPHSTEDEEFSDQSESLYNKQTHQLKPSDTKQFRESPIASVKLVDKEQLTRCRTPEDVNLRTPRKREPRSTDETMFVGEIDPLVMDEVFSSPGPKNERMEKEDIADGVKNEYVVEHTPHIDLYSIKNETEEDLMYHSELRSGTPSPPNSRRFSSMISSSSSGTKPGEPFILQPRTQAKIGDCVAATTSRIHLGWGSSPSRKLISPENVLFYPLDISDSSASTEGRRIPQPLEDSKDPLNKNSEDSEENRILKKKLSANQKKLGCRCGSATACPGKLTCYGQRCPCYVNMSPCIDCKCRGCNNPLFTVGGGKIMSRVNLVNYTSSSDLPVTSVVRVPSGNSDNSMTDVDINTIPVVNITSPNSYATLLGPSPRVLGTSLHQGTPSSTTTSTLSTVTVVPASSLSTVSIPLSSLNPTLKLRPVHQLQRKEIKARVIPTTFRLKTAPYPRLPLNGKVAVSNGVRYQTISLMSLLKTSQKGLQNVQALGLLRDPKEGEA